MAASSTPVQRASGSPHGTPAVPAEVVLLTRLGATYLQGFRLAEPMSGSAAAEFFASRTGLERR